LKPARRREVAIWIFERFRVSTVRACRLALLRRDLGSVINGFTSCCAGKAGTLIVRVHRLYRLDGLQVRMRVRRRKRRSLHRGPVPQAAARNQHWSMDFVHDQLLDGRRFRVLTVIDQWSRESVLLEAGFTLTGQSVAAALERVAGSRPLPKAITVDHGTEFTSRALDEWACRRGVELAFITPGKTTENGLCESFDGRLRDEWSERQ